MACNEWKERLVESLYDELPPGEERRWSAHLEACAACRSELRELRETRAALRDAEPTIPVAPRVVILARQPRRAPLWAVAASLAGLGLLAGLALSWGWQARNTAARLAAEIAATRPADPAVLPAALPDVELDRRVREGIERYLALHPNSPAEPLTRAELDALLARYDRKLERERASDIQYVLQELAGVEARTTLQLGETQQAIRYVALSSDPRVSER